MSPTTHAVVAYAVTILLLWGYAAILWLSTRRLNSINKHSNPVEDTGKNPGNDPGAIRGGSTQL